MLETMLKITAMFDVIALFIDAAAVIACIIWIIAIVRGRKNND